MDTLETVTRILILNEIMDSNKNIPTKVLKVPECSTGPTATIVVLCLVVVFFIFTYVLSDEE